MSIELRVSEKDPPTIIMDVVNLPDPVYLGFTIVAYNYDDVGLYFQITGSGTGWTFSTVNLGLIGSGASLRTNLDNFCNRARPASETSEQIQFILRAYTDSGYTNLKWTYTKTVNVWWIKSDDGSWTEDLLNNFDDGTVQTWAATGLPITGSVTIVGFGVATDYVLSTPYSLKMTARHYDAAGEFGARIYKTINTPDRNYVFAVFDLRQHPGLWNSWWVAIKNVQIINGTTTVTLLYLGRPINSAKAHYVPVDRWMRYVIPLPRNSSLEFRIELYAYSNGYGANFDIITLTI